MCLSEGRAGAGVRLGAAVRALEQLAPLEWAEEWDNVGLLVEPPRRRTVHRVLVAIDLTEAVLKEAAARRADLVVAYHPPIFDGLRRLTSGSGIERVVLGCVTAGIAVYSPHTALDAAPGGVNDWLADGLGRGERQGLQPVGEPASGAAQGRRVRLQRPVRLSTVVRRIKEHLGLRTVRVATADAHRRAAVRDIALCAGAGGSVLAGVAADVYWTGEMRHHDVLAALARGCSVVLCEHSNTERGYLPRLCAQLRAALPGVEVERAAADSEPLRPA